MLFPDASSNCCNAFFLGSWIYFQLYKKKYKGQLILTNEK